MNVRTQALAKLLRVLPRTRITRAVGHLCDLELPTLLSRAVVGTYTRAYRVDLSEAAPLDGRGAYHSFDAFFTRALRPGARPKTPRDEIICPADGEVIATGAVTDDGLITVKGSPYRANDLLGGPDESERYRGGRFAVIYLSPRDYHRVHAPAAGTLSAVRSYPGELLPVNDLGRRSCPDLLVRNRRVALAIDNDAIGRVTVVMVAALVVGRITAIGLPERDVPLGIHRLTPPLPIAAGDEIGIFHLGSTVVLFVEAAMARALAPKLGAIQVGCPLSPSGNRPAIESPNHGGCGDREDEA